MHRCDSSDFCIPNWVSYCSSLASVVVAGVRAGLWKALGDSRLELLPPQQAVLTWAQLLTRRWACEGVGAQKMSIQFEDVVSRGG
jgi:hypothetical protein